jgi:hypothetical protein
VRIPRRDDEEESKHPLSRDTGANIFQVVAEGTEPTPIVKEVSFIADTLFCEWAYVVDLDSGNFEVYAGIREGKRQSRLGEAEGVQPGHEPSLIGEWALSGLPSEPDFLKACEETEEEEESGVAGNFM